MYNHWFKLMLLIWLCFDCVGCGPNDSVPKQALAEFAPLQCDPRVLALGDVSATSSYSLTLPLRNTASFPVTIESLQTSCGCTLAERDFSSAILSPGQQLDVRLLLDLWPRKRGDNSSPFSVNVIAHLDKHITQTWTIEASVYHALILESGENSVALSAEILKELHSTIEITPVIPLKDCHASVSIPGCSAVLTQEVSSIRVHISSPPHTMPGKEDGELIVTGYAVDGSRREVHWPMVIAWEHDLVLQPAIQELGAIPVGVTTVQDFQVASRTAREIQSLSAAVIDLNNCRGDVKVDEQDMRLEVNVIPIEPGRFSMSFSVDGHSDSPAIFTASGYGYAPRR